MGKLIALLAGLVLAAAPREAEAATFTPDMWVYEVTLEAAALDGFWFAWTDAAPGTPVPEGCTGGDVEGEWEGLPYVTIVCQQNPGIDVWEPLGGRESFNRVSRVGFNASTIICDSQLIVGCPASAEEPTEWIGSAGFTDILLNAVLGTLSYCGFVVYADYACYDFSPDLVTSSTIMKNVGDIGGDWDYGYGGAWLGYPGDNYVRYSATGRLVSSPSVVPLPVPALMLGSALAALGLMAQGGLRRRRPAPPPMG
jgi:hypothetical protein